MIIVLKLVKYIHWGFQVGGNFYLLDGWSGVDGLG
jgi:hypothetical protein